MAAGKMFAGEATTRCGFSLDFLTLLVVCAVLR